jgi:hypothetical protein
LKTALPPRTRSSIERPFARFGGITTSVISDRQRNVRVGRRSLACIYSGVIGRLQRVIRRPMLASASLRLNAKTSTRTGSRTTFALRFPADSNRSGAHRAGV